MLLTLLRLGDTTLHYTRVTSGLACTKNRVTVTLLGAEVVDRKATWVVKGEKANLDILLQKSVQRPKPNSSATSNSSLAKTCCLSQSLARTDSVAFSPQLTQSLKWLFLSDPSDIIP
jgi:hypothetical protein